MGLHRGRLAVYVNRCSFRNFALGFDRYQEIEVIWDEPEVVANCLALNFLLFNITITLWKKG